jgi:hypothetical protein
MAEWPNDQMARSIEGVKVHKVIPRPTALRPSFSTKMS